MLFPLFFLLLLGGTIYVSWRIWWILPFPVFGKWIAVALLVGCLSGLVLNFVIGLDDKPLPVAAAMYGIGNSSPFILLYLATLFLAFDLGRLVHLVPDKFLLDNWSGTLTVFAILFCTFLYGSIHYRHKVRVPLDLTAEKPLVHPLRIVMVSDLHLGYHNRAKEFRRWVDLLNAEHPDLVLIGGDIIDGSIRAVRAQKMEEEFRRLNAPVYACLGNHEYYSGKAESVKFYEDAGLHLLMDAGAAFVCKGDTLVLIGRDDRSNPNRKTLAQLKAEAPDGTFTLLLDHQPDHLEEAQQAGIDFQFSGHTHHGQVWPASWITNAIFENAFGPYRKGNTRYYVSSGLGIWGGKFRIGTRSEYLVVTLK